MVVLPGTTDLHPFRSEDDIESGARPGFSAQVAAIWSRSSRRLLFELLDQRILDAEHRIRCQQLIAFDEDMSDEVRLFGAVTMKCRWLARIGERPVAASILPTGPSSGIG